MLRSLAFVLFMGFQLHLSDLEALARQRAPRGGAEKQFESKAFLGANRAVYRSQMNEMEESFGELLASVAK